MADPNDSMTMASRGAWSRYPLMSCDETRDLLDKLDGMDTKAMQRAMADTGNTITIEQTPYVTRVSIWKRGVHGAMVREWNDPGHLDERVRLSLKRILDLEWGIFKCR